MESDQEPGGVFGPDARWPALLALLVALALYFALPTKLVEGPIGILGAIRYVVAIAVLSLVVALLSTRLPFDRPIAIAAVAVATGANAVSLGLLVHAIFTGIPLKGRELVIGSAAIWWTNVIVFGVWFWLLDQGGPARRAAHLGTLPEFLYPQLLDPRIAPDRWRPSFVDYLYVSFTNAAAFSPTDTMPLTQRAKSLMLLQAAASILTLITVASRAVNVL